MKKCVFAGTFDPPTKGHLHIVEKCLEIFDEAVVAVMVNPEKTPLLTEEERISLLKKLFEGENRVKVRSFYGAAVDLLKEENTPFYVRGVRNTVDFEYENQNHFASKKLYGGIITIYIPAEQEEIHISSSLVRTSLKFDKEIFDYVPEKIKGGLLELLRKKRCLKSK
ncbi:MAG: pantetheine-phosphate adenylyltransferase [Clostridia bacterium]|nr:pantetheine-phosphate adenylyltransferase [Clostridia bacterium]